MKNNITKKLSLKKETLRALMNTELNGVVGGGNPTLMGAAQSSGNPGDPVANPGDPQPGSYSYGNPTQ